MRFMRRSVKTTGIQIKPQGYITFVTRAAPLIRPLTIIQINLWHKSNLSRNVKFGFLIVKAGLELTLGGASHTHTL